MSEVEGKYWLLTEAETLPCIKVTHFQNSSEKKGNSSEKKAFNSENYSQSKVNESKVEESKVSFCADAQATPQKKNFTKPSVEEVRNYCLERHNSIDAQQFFDFYESKGWRVGNQPMRDWRACVRTWEKNGRNNTVITKPTAKDVDKLNEKIRSITADDI